MARGLKHEREEAVARLVPTAGANGVHTCTKSKREEIPRLVPMAEEQQRKLMPKAEERCDADVRAQA